MLFFKYSYAAMQKHYTTQIFPCSVMYGTVLLQCKNTTQHKSFLVQ